MDATFATTREGVFLRALTTAVEATDEDAFTDTVRRKKEQKHQRSSMSTC